MTPKIEDLVDALKAEYPYITRDTEAIALGDKLRQDMFTLLRKDAHKKGALIGKTLTGEDIFESQLAITADDIEVLRKKLTLLEDGLKLTGLLRDLVEKLPPAEEGGEFKEAGSAVDKFKNRSKRKDESTGNQE